MEVKPEFQQMSRQEIENHLITKATTDGAFRSLLIADPRTALEQEIGLSLPADFELKVIEESANGMYLVIPPAQGELSDLELEGVAGGKGGRGGSKPPVMSPGKGAGMVNAGGLNKGGR